MKTTLETADQDKVWRMCGRTWPIYVYRENQWWCFPCDPRLSPTVRGIVASVSPRDGLVHSHSGWEEVPHD